MRIARRVVIVAALGGFRILNFGCPPPMPVIPAPKKIIGYRGEVRKVDMTPLQNGTATRDDIRTRLGWSDVGLKRLNQRDADGKDLVFDMEIPDLLPLVELLRHKRPDALY